MRIVNFPYRWTLRTAWANVSHAWSDITGGVSNLVRWAPIVWQDRWYDSDFLLKVMEFKLRHMAAKFDHHGCHMGAERDAAQMRECAELCRRIQEDEYFSLDRRRYFEGNRSWLYGRRRDMKRLGLLMGKHLLKWWD